jgi:hypothetical protein
MTRILLDDGLLEVTGYWMNKIIGRVITALPFYYPTLNIGYIATD